MALVGSLKTLFTGDTQALDEACKRALAQLGQVQRQVSALSTSMKKGTMVDATMFTLDTRGVDQASKLIMDHLGQVQRKINSLDTSMKKGFGVEATGSINGMAGALGGLAVAAAAAYAVKKTAEGMVSSALASDKLAGSVRALNTVFGMSGSRQVQAAVDQMARTMGSARAETQQLAATLGGTLGNNGLGAQAAGLTVKLLSRAADMATTFGQTTEQAVEAISAAIRGEVDPIEKFGIGVGAAAVEAELLKNGVAKVNGEYTKFDKTLTTINMILEQSNKTQGAAASGVDTSTAALKRADEAYNKLSTTIGKKTGPVVSWFGDRMYELWDSIDKGLNSNWGDLTDEKNAAWMAAKEAEAAQKRMEESTKRVTKATRALSEEEKKRMEAYSKHQAELAKKGDEKRSSLLESLGSKKLGISSEVMDLAKMVQEGSVGPKMAPKYLKLIEMNNKAQAEAEAKKDKEQKFNSAVKNAQLTRAEHPYASAVTAGSQEARDLFMNTKFGYHNDTEGQRLLSESERQTELAQESADYQKQMMDALNLLNAKTMTSALAMMGEKF